MGCKAQTGVWHCSTSTDLDFCIRSAHLKKLKLMVKVNLWWNRPIFLLLLFFFFFLFSSFFFSFCLLFSIFFFFFLFFFVGLFVVVFFFVLFCFLFGLLFVFCSYRSSLGAFLYRVNALQNFLFWWWWYNFLLFDVVQKLWVSSILSGQFYGGDEYFTTLCYFSCQNDDCMLRARPTELSDLHFTAPSGSFAVKRQTTWKQRKGWQGKLETHYTHEERRCRMHFISVARTGG